MSKFKLSLMLVTMAAFSMPALAGEKVVKRVPAGAVAFHFVLDLNYVTGDLVGYVAFIEGVDGDFFNGPPSEDTAYFTVRLTKLTPPPIPLPVEPDPALSVQLLEPGGQFSVYFDSNPDGRDWTFPESFEKGVPIAVFEESALLNTVANANFPGVGFNVFSNKLIDSTRINFNGQRIDFKKLVPNGVTITNFCNGVRFYPGPGADCGATAIAIGGKLKDVNDDDSDD